MDLVSVQEGITRQVGTAGIIAFLEPAAAEVTEPFRRRR